MIVEIAMLDKALHKIKSNSFQETSIVIRLAIADIVSGRKPDVDFAFTGM